MFVICVMVNLNLLHTCSYTVIWLELVWHGSKLSIKTTELNQVVVKQWLARCILMNRKLDPENMKILQSPNYVYHLMDNLEPQKSSGTRGQMS